MNTHFLFRLVTKYQSPHYMEIWSLSTRLKLNTIPLKPHLQSCDSCGFAVNDKNLVLTARTFENTIIVMVWKLHSGSTHSSFSTLFSPPCATHVFPTLNTNQVSKDGISKGRRRSVKSFTWIILRQVEGCQKKRERERGGLGNTFFNEKLAVNILHVVPLELEAFC